MLCMYTRQMLGLLYFYTMGYLRRESVMWLGSILDTVAMLTLLILIGRGTLFPHILVGASIAFAYGAGVGQLSVDLVGLRLSKFKYVFVSSPLSPTIYMIGAAIGMSIPSLIYLIPIVSIVVAIQRPGLAAVFQYLVVLLCVWIIGIGLGFLIASFSRTSIHAMYASRVLISLTVYLMPVYYPLSSLPEYIRILTFVSPTTHAALIARSLLGISGAASSSLNYIALGLFTTAIPVVALKYGRWREND